MKKDYVSIEIVEEIQSRIVGVVQEYKTNYSKELIEAMQWFIKRLK